MSGKLRIRRGTHAQLPPLGIGEEAYTLDDKVLSIGGLSGNEPIGGGGSQGATGLPGAGYQPNVYLVPSVYSTIQAAIDQAFADGHTASSNQASVSIAPGTYNENLTLRCGVSLHGTSSLEVYVLGNAVYQPQINQSESANHIVLSAITFHSNSTGSVLTVASGNAAQITAINCTFRKDAGDTTTAVIFNNSQGQLILDNAAIFHLDPGAVQLDIQSGNVLMRNGAAVGNQTIIYTANAIKVAGQLNVQASKIGANGESSTGYPNLIEITSPSAQCFVDYSILINGLIGSNNILYTAPGMCQLRHTDIYNNFGTGFTTLALGASGILRVSHNAYDQNYVAPGITLQHAGQYDDVNFDDRYQKIYVGGSRGFPTITAALNWGDQAGLNQIYIVVDPGFYSENIVIPADKSVIIQSWHQNYSDTAISGSITYNPTTSQHFQLLNMSVFAQPGQSCFSYGGTGSSFIEIAGCNFQSVDSATMINLSNPTGSIYFANCYFNQQSSSNPMFDIATSDVSFTGLNIYGNLEFFSQNFPFYDVLIQSPLFFIRSTCNYLVFRHLTIDCEVDTLFRFDGGGYTEFEYCNINHTTNIGQTFYFSANATVNTVFSQFAMPGNPNQSEFSAGGSGAALAREGVAASGLINIVNNSISAGDSVTIGTKAMVAGTDWAVGGTSVASALNLAIGINTASALSGVVYAIVNNNAVEVYAFKNGAVGNSIALSTSNAGSFSLSGSTLTGGVNGSGAAHVNTGVSNFVFGGATMIQNTIARNNNGTSNPTGF